jgi:hypothetical protein
MYSRILNLSPGDIRWCNFWKKLRKVGNGKEKEGGRKVKGRMEVKRVK